VEQDVALTLVASKWPAGGLLPPPPTAHRRLCTTRPRDHPSACFGIVAIRYGGFRRTSRAKAVGVEVLWSSPTEEQPLTQVSPAHSRSTAGCSGHILSTIAPAHHYSPNETEVSQPATTRCSDRPDRPSPVEDSTSTVVLAERHGHPQPTHRKQRFLSCTVNSPSQVAVNTTSACSQRASISISTDLDGTRRPAESIA
jgi:hypothetical protein